MTNLEISSLRLYHQYLAREKLDTPTRVVEELGAVQAQDYGGGLWALALRLRGEREVEVERAFDQGEILRTHVLRPTWHFVTPQDIGWMLELTAPRVHAFNRTMYRKMGVDADLVRASQRAMRKALQGERYLTRTELAKALTGHGILTGDGIRLGLLMMHAELDGLICSGPRRGKQHTYALVQERAPQVKKVGREQALYELAKRYFSTRGPATAQDFAWWSGLTLTEARKGFDMVRREMQTEQVEKQLYAFPAPAPVPPKRSPTALLLPNYDEYFIGYRDRSAIGERVREHAPEELNRALSGHVLVVDGQLVGGWKRTLNRTRVTVEIHRLVSLSQAEERAVESAAGQYAKFLGLELELVEKRFDDKRRTGLFT